MNLLLDRGADAHVQMSDGANALIFAVLGANDIDRAPICTSTVRQPMRIVTSVKLQTCAGVAALLGTRYPS